MHHFPTLLSLPVCGERSPLIFPPTSSSRRRFAPAGEGLLSRQARSEALVDHTTTCLQFQFCSQAAAILPTDFTQRNNYASFLPINTFNSVELPLGEKKKKKKKDLHEKYLRC